MKLRKSPSVTTTDMDPADLARDIQVWQEWSCSWVYGRNPNAGIRFPLNMPTRAALSKVAVAASDSPEDIEMEDAESAGRSENDDISPDDDGREENEFPIEDRVLGDPCGVFSLEGDVISFLR